MSVEITRTRFLKRAAGGALGAAAAGAALPAAARAASLDASFTAPYPPNPVINYPSTWFVYTALFPGVVIPYDVVVCNRVLGPLPDVNGGPDLRAVPTDATVLMLFIYEPVPTTSVTAPDISQAISLTGGSSMKFSDLGGGQINYWGFRQFLGWYVATSSGDLYSVEARVYVGPEAGTEWAQVQPIVDSIYILL